MEERMAVISTANIDLQTEQWLQEQLRKYDTGDNDIVIYPKAEYGYFIPITDTVFFPDEYPDAFNDAIAYANEKNCQWLMIDRDCEDVPELKTYNW